MKLKTVFSTIVVFVLGLIVLAVPAGAQQTNCPNPGPYGICPPDTDIVLGGIIIDDAVLTLAVVGLVVGIFFVANGLVLKRFAFQFSK